MMNKLTVEEWINLFKAAGITREDIEEDRIIVAVMHGPTIFPNGRRRKERGYPLVENDHIITIANAYKFASDGKVWTDKEWREIEKAFDIEREGVES